ncbi:MAG: SRPBCC domain-containing protein [Rhizomicrobium sp.]
MKARHLAVLALATLLFSPARAAVKDDSFQDADGARVLRESVVVDAARPAVWAAFTDDGAFMQWSGVPVAHITPGNGGTIEFGLMPGAKIGDPGNVRHRIVLWLPDAMLAWQNEFVPAGGPFDPATFATVRTVMTFEDAGAGRTKVTETVIGFATGTRYDELYDHLRGGNAEYLIALAGRFGKN